MNSTPNSSCTDEIMQIIQTIIDQNSPYAAAYKCMHAVKQSEELCASTENRSPREVRLHFKHGPDQRRYNEPTHDEVDCTIPYNAGLLIEGTIAVSFCAACIQKHLLTDDSEYVDALTEASGFQMPRQLRNMFATIYACDPLSQG